jgi:hypothetical protein
MGSETVSSFTVSSRAPRSGKARPSPMPRAMAAKIHTGSSRSMTESFLTTLSAGAGAFMDSFATCRHWGRGT